MKLKMGNGPVIAQREFYLKGQKDKRITLRIRGATPEDPDYYFDMDGVDYVNYPCMVGGADSLQALMHTIIFLESWIKNVNEKFFHGNLRRFEDDDLDLGVYTSFKK